MLRSSSPIASKLLPATMVSFELLKRASAFWSFHLSTDFWTTEVALDVVGFGYIGTTVVLFSILESHSRTGLIGGGNLSFAGGITKLFD